uniref:Ig-like domain-containing protein n=1 Tax=Sander lucioperca TaxID=283035 RepID=A0A8D0D324_SANLU
DRGAKSEGRPGYTCRELLKHDFLLLIVINCCFSGQIVVTVHPGDNVTLPCQAAGSSIRAVEWTRPDLEPDTVLLYIDGHLKPDYQHPSFKDRVELVDRDLKDGNVSLILKNVNRHDTGTYTCGVKTGDTDQIRLIRTVRLQVTGEVVSLRDAAVVGVLMYKRRKNKRSGQPADDDDDDDDDDEADGKASPGQLI